jgi:hypothetical protein
MSTTVRPTSVPVGDLIDTWRGPLALVTEVTRLCCPVFKRVLGNFECCCRMATVAPASQIVAWETEFSSRKF